MRAAAGLLLLLIGLCGSQAQLGDDAERSNLLTEVKAIKGMLAEVMVKQMVLEMQVNELKEKQDRGKQSEKATLLYLWVLIPIVRVLLALFVSFCSKLKV